MPLTVGLKSIPDKPSGAGSVRLDAEVSGGAKGARGGIRYEWALEGAGLLVVDPNEPSRAIWRPENAGPGKHTVKVVAKRADDSGSAERDVDIPSEDSTALRATDGALRRAENPRTSDLALWVVIRKATDALDFERYSHFIDIVLCGAEALGKDAFGRTAQDYRNAFNAIIRRRLLPFADADAYRAVKAATEAFVMMNADISVKPPPFTAGDVSQLAKRVGVTLTSTQLENYWLEYLAGVSGGVADATLPYLSLRRDKPRDSSVVGDINDGPSGESEVGTSEVEDVDRDRWYGLAPGRLTHPRFLELIWSYWHEEGLLAQSMNAISTRFQNIRGPGENDPLRTMEIDALRPLNNLLWGYIQDEQHRLTVVRRAHEYDHHYGLSLQGRALPALNPADSRSKFLEAFDRLLFLCSELYKQDDDTTLGADGLPLLNALRDVHLLLSEGAHNQYGDLPSTARIEMLMEQWVLARPEFREYLSSRIMVAYPEPWMDRVDGMKMLQGWTDTSVLHFRNLGVFGEQVLLSIRFGTWTTVTDPLQAANWARFWRAEIQGYIHAHRVVRGEEDRTSDSAVAR